MAKSHCHGEDVVNAGTQEMSQLAVECPLLTSGPPSWASGYGQDQYGYFAEISLRAKGRANELVTQRVRWIPAGEFLMGSSTEDKESNDNERPVHLVRISRGFWLFDSPCTQGLWQALMVENPSRFKGAGLPVESVSWESVQAFVLAFNTALLDLSVRLPTESEWEYACRGPGAEQALSRYGDLNEIAWYGENSDGCTQVVKQLRANGYGLYDMIGNVWEWCTDRYGPYSEESLADPPGPTEGSVRVIRGGGWVSTPCYARASCRDWSRPSDRFNFLGFRLLSCSQTESGEFAEPVSASGHRRGIMD